LLVVIVVSAVEVLETYLAQIARYNPMLNALVTLDEEGSIGSEHRPPMLP
jgi:Asp-tRNA(Asn)/Glu-tRNA(Gln) amidotransferase A subunit family amidase